MLWVVQVFQKLLEAVKKEKKLAQLITSEDKSNKQQNQATHSLSLATKPQLSTDLIFRSQQIWGDKNTFQLSCDQLCVKRCFIHLEVLLDWIIPHQVRR